MSAPPHAAGPPPVSAAKRWNPILGAYVHSSTAERDLLDEARSSSIYMYRNAMVSPHARRVRLL